MLDSFPASYPGLSSLRPPSNRKHFLKSVSGPFSCKTTQTCSLSSRMAAAPTARWRSSKDTAPGFRRGRARGTKGNPTPSIRVFPRRMGTFIAGSTAMTCFYRTPCGKWPKLIRNQSTRPAFGWLAPQRNIFKRREIGRTTPLLFQRKCFPGRIPSVSRPAFGRVGFTDR